MLCAFNVSLLVFFRSAYAVCPGRQPVKSQGVASACTCVYVCAHVGHLMRLAFEHAFTVAAMHAQVRQTTQVLLATLLLFASCVPQANAA